MGLKSSEKCPYKRQKRRQHRDTQRGKLCEHGGRNSSYIATSQQMSESTGGTKNWKKQDRCPLEPQKEHCPSGTFILDFSPSEL